MSVYDEHAASLGKLEEELGEECPKFKWAGKDWTILPGSALFAKDLDLGGFKLVSRLTFTARTQQFPQSPEATKNAMMEREMWYNGDRFVIKMVSIAPAGKQLEIEAHQVAP